MRMWPVVLFVLMLTGCAAAYAATAAALAPTLHVTNLTDNQVNVTLDGRTIARVGSLGEACVRLTNVPLGAVILSFRPLSGVALRAQPTDYAAVEGWSLTLTSASHDGGFFASPAPRCRG